VRNAGATVKPPLVSKNRPFDLRGFKTFWLMSSKTTQTCELEIHADMFEPPLVSPGRTAGRLENIQVIGDGRSMNRAVGYSHGWEDPVMRITRDVEVPNHIRNVTFKANLSINECWPMPIEVALRKDGKNITREKPSLN
jgi:hypothetical protein